jgi:hypothetical protein
MKKIYEGIRAIDDTGNTYEIGTNELRKQTMTNEEAKKWVQVFEAWHDRFVIENYLEKGDEL